MARTSDFSATLGTASREQVRFPDGEVGRDHDGALFIAGGDQLEEQVGGVVVEGYVADFVDDDEFVAADLPQFGFEPVGVVRGPEAGDPVAGGIEQYRVAGVGGFDA